MLPGCKSAWMKLSKINIFKNELSPLSLISLDKFLPKFLFKLKIFSMGTAFTNSSTKTSRVVKLKYGLGKWISARFLKLYANLAKFNPSILKSSCIFINMANWSTSSGNDNHSMVGIILMTLAKNFINRKSALILTSTLGCNTLTATNWSELRASLVT